MNEQYKFAESRKPVDQLEFSDREMKTINNLGLTFEDLQKLLDGPSFAEGSYALIFELPDDKQKAIAKVWKNPKQDSERAEHENAVLRLLRMRNPQETPQSRGFLKSATILFEEKIEGKPIESFDKSTIDQLAETLAKIHSIELNAYGKPLTRRTKGTKMDFLNDEFDRLRTDLTLSSEQSEIISSVEQAINKTENKANKKPEAFQDNNFTLIHFDLNSNNILRSTNDQIVIIDWEQASAGDNAMDIAKMFLKLNFNEEQKKDFLVEYEKKLSKKDEYFESRIEVFEPLVLVNSILWRLRALKDVPLKASSINEEQFHIRVKNNLDKELEALKKYLS
ncbi:MAG: aminoglycoside phosphotransferase family protein [Patescibacteria group bacterium]|nr:aminoglycoside phosphotransferase family protein [Patescibacteria group bacterium]